MASVAFAGNGASPSPLLDTTQELGELDVGADIPTRPMRVKVLYTFDSENRTNCLARLPNFLDIPVVTLEGGAQIGVIQLRTCITAIVSASPELLTKLENDYTVYAYDFSEYEIPLVGQGMLSRMLASNSPTPHAPADQSGTMITGRVCRNILGLFANGGIKETLEVKLKLVAVPTKHQSEYDRTMESYRNQQSRGPSDQLHQMDTNKTANMNYNSHLTNNHNMKINRSLDNSIDLHQNLNMNPNFNISHNINTTYSSDMSRNLTATSNLHTSHDNIISQGPMISSYGNTNNNFSLMEGGHAREFQQLSSPHVHSSAKRHASESAESLHDMLTPRFANGYEECQSRANSVYGGNAPGVLDQMSELTTGVSLAPQSSRPPSRSAVQYSQSDQNLYNQSGGEFMARKRAKLTQTSEWQGRTNFGAQPDSLRVAASNTASIRGFRPSVASTPAVTGLPPRAPTPRPDVRRMRPTTLTQNPSGLRRGSTLSESCMPSSSDNGGYDDGPTGMIASSPDMPSSPPVFDTQDDYQQPAVSSPMLPEPPPMGDSEFQSDSPGILAPSDTSQPISPQSDTPQPIGLARGRSTTVKFGADLWRQTRLERNSKMDWTLFTPTDPPTAPAKELPPPSSTTQVASDRATSHSRARSALGLSAPVKRPRVRRRKPKTTADKPTSPPSTAMCPTVAPISSVVPPPLVAPPPSGGLQPSNAPSPSTIPPPSIAPPTTAAPLISAATHRPIAPRPLPIPTPPPSLAAPSPVAIVPSDRHLVQYSTGESEGRIITGEQSWDSTAGAPGRDRAGSVGTPLPTSLRPATPRNDMADYLEVPAPPAGPTSRITELPKRHPRQGTRPESRKCLPRSNTLTKPSSDIEDSSTSEITGNKSRQTAASVRQNTIQRQLKQAVATGERPTYCGNCGAIETPTWRPYWVHTGQGTGEDVVIDSTSGIHCVHPFEKDGEGNVLTHRVYKRHNDLKADDKEKYERFILCNPCGDYLRKHRVHRPQLLFDKVMQKPSGDKKGTNRNRVRSKNAIAPSSNVPGAQNKIVPASNASVNHSGQQAQQASKSSRATLREMFNPEEIAESDALALIHAIQQSPARGAAAAVQQGTKECPVELPEDLAPNPVRRLLFPSPRKAGEFKSLAPNDSAAAGNPPAAAGQSSPGARSHLLAGSTLPVGSSDELTIVGIAAVGERGNDNGESDKTEVAELDQLEVGEAGQVGVMEVEQAEVVEAEQVEDVETGQMVAADVAPATTIAEARLTDAMLEDVAFGEAHVGALTEETTEKVIAAGNMAVGDDQADKENRPPQLSIDEDTLAYLLNFHNSPFVSPSRQRTTATTLQSEPNFANSGLVADATQQQQQVPASEPPAAPKTPQHNPMIASTDQMTPWSAQLLEGLQTFTSPVVGGSIPVDLQGMFGGAFADLQFNADARGIFDNSFADPNAAVAANNHGSVGVNDEFFNLPNAFVSNLLGPEGFGTGVDRNSIRFPSSPPFAAAVGLESFEFYEDETAMEPQLTTAATANDANANGDNSRVLGDTDGNATSFGDGARENAAATTGEALSDVNMLH